MDPPPAPGNAHGYEDLALFALLSVLSSLLCSLFVFSMLFLIISIPWGTIWGSSGVLGMFKNSIFIDRVSKFKLFALAASDAAWGSQNHPNTGYITCPSSSKGAPGEPEEPSKTIPNNAKHKHSSKAAPAPGAARPRHWRRRSAGAERRRWSGVGAAAGPRHSTAQ